MNTILFTCLSASNNYIFIGKHLDYAKEWGIEIYDKFIHCLVVSFTTNGQKADHPCRTQHCKYCHGMLHTVYVGEVALVQSSVNIFFHATS